MNTQYLMMTDPFKSFLNECLFLFRKSYIGEAHNEYSRRAIIKIDSNKLMTSKIFNILKKQQVTNDV